MSESRTAGSETERAEQAAHAIVERLRGLGHQAYYAGGSARDRLLGMPAKDYDIATSAHPEVVLGAFPRAFGVGAHFGVVLVATAHADGSETVTEVATFRRDGAYSDGRRPDAVRYAETPQEDVLRRDFTINGMLWDPVEERLLDCVGGEQDLRSGVVRAIGEPGRRFAEDKLRMLRAVRFAARFGFTLEEGTAAAIRAQAGKVHQVSRERVRDELTRMLTEGHARHAFELLQTTGLLRELLPEVEKMRGVAQPPEFHPEGDVWVHTLLLLEQLEPGCAPALGWAALLHDVGKAATFAHAPGDRIRFNGHAEVGTRMAEEIAGRLRFSNELAEQVSLLVRHHMRFGDVEQMKESTLKRFFRLPRFAEHLALHRMDCVASHGMLRLYDYAVERYEAMPEEQVRPALLLTGKDLIAAGYVPGPAFRAMLALAEDAQLEGRVRTRDEALELVRDAGTRA